MLAKIKLKFISRFCASAPASFGHIPTQQKRRRIPFSKQIKSFLYFNISTQNRDCWHIVAMVWSVSAAKPLIYTIGHSTHPLEELEAMLHSFDIEVLVDVRSFPGSRKYPQFNRERLELSMPAAGIAYQNNKALGGRRKPSAHSYNTGWRSVSFRSYADYMETEEFKIGLEVLKELALQKKVAYMCSEAVWWRCHRGLISDKLKSEGWEVMHIMGIGKAKEHPYTAPAVVADGKLSYPGPPELTAASKE